MHRVKDGFFSLIVFGLHGESASMGISALIARLTCNTPVFNCDYVERI